MISLAYRWPRAQGPTRLHNVTDYAWSKIDRDATRVTTACGRRARPFPDYPPVLPLCRRCYPISWRVEALAVFAEELLRHGAPDGLVTPELLAALRWWQS